MLEIAAVVWGGRVTRAWRGVPGETRAAVGGHEAMLKQAKKANKQAINQAKKTNKQTHTKNHK
jgi:hypothetical protein